MAGLAFLVPAGTAGTAALFVALQAAGPLAWGLSCLVLTWLALFLAVMLPRLRILSEKALREPGPGELPPGTARCMGLLSGAGGRLGEGDILVSLAFYPGLQPPFVMASKILVPEKALEAYTPKALEAGIAAAALGHSIGAARGAIALRFFSMALAAPASLILLNSVGLLLGFPAVAGFGLAGLFWAGVWMAYWFSGFVSLFVERAVSARVCATVAALTMDARGLYEYVELTARGNLDPVSRKPVTELFRARRGAVAQFEAVKAAVREMADAAAGRRFGQAGCGKAGVAGTGLKGAREGGGDAGGGGAGRPEPAEVTGRGAGLAGAGGNGAGRSPGPDGRKAGGGGEPG
jgi:hypothetical protein